MSSAPTSVDRFRRTGDFERRTSGLRLKPIEWHILLALDGSTTFMDVARLFNLPSDEAATILGRFEGLGLVETQRVSLEEFRAQNRPPLSVAGPAEPALVPPPLSAEPPANEPEQPESVAAAPAPRVTFSLKRSAPAPDGG
jgi:hypothetical protein